MKKIFTILAIAASVMAVSCGKDNGDDNGGSTKKEENKEEQKEEKKEETTVSSLNGSNYYVIALDETTYNSISSKVVADLRPDETNRFLYVWEGTYEGGAGSGVNFYGNADGYTDLIVTSVGWSGAGYFISANDASTSKFAAIGADPANYYLHVGYKGKAGVAHMLFLVFGDSTYSFVVGEGSFTDNGVTKNAIAPVSGTFEANEWNEYEICIKDAGVDYTASFPSNGTNIFTFLSGGVTGNEIALDAVFIYKK